MTLADRLPICRQTGTSLDMLLQHYGCVRTMAAELDEVIGVGAA